jgi:hypothetical protein
MKIFIKTLDIAAWKVVKKEWKPLLKGSTSSREAELKSKDD